MTRRTAAMLLVLAAASGAAAQNKGYCPQSPAPMAAFAKKTSPSAPAPPVSAPDSKYAGTVRVLAVVSDAGYVCSTQVLKGINKQVNKEAEKTVRQWHFDPARKDGRPVPVVVSVDIAYWMKSNGELVQATASPNAPTANAAPDQNH